MSPLTSTQTYVFAGEMQLGEELIDIALEFQGDSVRLRHADTVIGSWPRDETGFVRLSSDHYRVTADGDSISFHPFTATQFAQFLSGDIPDEDAPVSIGGNGTAPAADDQTAVIDEDGLGPQPDHPETTSELPLWDSIGDGIVEQELPLEVEDESGSISPDSVHGPNPARPVYPPTEPEPVRFSSPPPPTSITDHTDRHPWQQANGQAETLDPHTTSPDPDGQLLPPALTPVPGPPGRTETRNPAPEPTDTARPETTSGDGAIIGPNLDPEPGLPGPIHAPAPAENGGRARGMAEEAAPTSPVESEVSEPIQNDSIAAVAADLLERIRHRITWIRSLVRPDQDPAVTPEPTPADEGPRPAEDADNLRQWAMVSVVGLAVMGLLAALAWGAISLFGGTDGTAPTPTTIPPPPSSVANAIDRTPATTTAVPSVGPPVTTVPLDRPSFIDRWNELASDYAYNLAIDAGGEPVSTALTANIHLSFDDDRVLTLDMTPVGNGSDRDILVAMGMAVAWAEPDLSPSARKDLLGSLGIDIDNPRLSDIGGELSRGGHTYRAGVIDGIIRFQVSPAA